MKNEAIVDHLKDRKGVRMFEPEDVPLGHRTTSTLSSVEKRDDYKAYMAFVKDANNHDEVAKTRQWLDSKVKDKNHIAQTGGAAGPLDGWYQLILDDSGVEEAKQYPGIEFVEEDWEMENQWLVPGTTEKTANTTENHDVWVKRADVKWAK